MPMMPHIAQSPSSATCSGARTVSARPGLVTWRARGRARARSAELLFGDHEPAATIALSPILIGATSAVFEPMKAPAPISVRASGSRRNCR
jgi:hypothetical protein